MSFISDKTDLLQAALDLMEPGSGVLDIGPGDCFAMDAFQAAGHFPTGIGLCLDSYIDEATRERHFLVEADYLKKSPEKKADAIWASHVLEHQPNPNAFIRKVFADLKPGGWLFVLVPPLKNQIVGGHVNLYNAGLLLYQLILGGFDCSQASVTTLGYNVAAFVRKVPAELPPLRYDQGDIEALAPFFPMEVHQGFNGKDISVNWPLPKIPENKT